MTITTNGTNITLETGTARIQLRGTSGTRYGMDVTFSGDAYPTMNAHPRTVRAAVAIVRRAAMNRGDAPLLELANALASRMGC